MDDIERETIAVTGGAGFIGSHLVDALLALGHRVVVLDDFSTGRRENLAQHTEHPNLRIVVQDVADDVAGALASVASEMGGVQRIVHLAAQTSVVKSLQAPVDDVRVNGAATLRVLEFAREHALKRVVFASSAAVYGDSDELPAHEGLPTQPLSPYGVHKLSGEHYLRLYRSVHGVPTNALRFFNVYGPRQDPKSPYSGVISIFLDRATRGLPLTIFGDGEQTRDFVFVGDVVAALLAALFGLTAQGKVYNVGTGTELSINDLAQLIVDAADSQSPVNHLDARSGEILRSRSSITRAEAELGFRPAVTMSQGLAETVAWFRGV